MCQSRPTRSARRRRVAREAANVPRAARGAACGRRRHVSQLVDEQLVENKNSNKQRRERDGQWLREAAVTEGPAVHSRRRQDGWLMTRRTEKSGLTAGERADPQRSLRVGHKSRHRCRPHTLNMADVNRLLSLGVPRKTLKASRSDGCAVFSLDEPTHFARCSHRVDTQGLSMDMKTLEV